MGTNEGDIVSAVSSDLFVGVTVEVLAAGETTLCCTGPDESTAVTLLVELVEAISLLSLRADEGGLSGSAVIDIEYGLPTRKAAHASGSLVGSSQASFGFAIANEQA